MGQVAHKVSVNEEQPDGDRRTAPRVSVQDNDPAVAGLLLGLDCVGRGAAILDRDGRLIGTNARGDALLADLAIRDGKLRGRTPAMSQRLDGIVERATFGAEAVVAIGVSSARTLVVRAIPLATGACRFRRAKVLLVLAQTGVDVLPSVDFVREAFGLTTTEAEVALALAGGAASSAIARERAISLETVRSHLKTIYAKTGTKRQAGLVASIMQLRDAAPNG